VHALVPGQTLQTLIDVQLLVTMPGSDAWCVPAVNWHVDGPRLRDRGCPGVQMFTFIDPVEPQGGGTLVVAGSHRLLNEGRFIASRDIKNRLLKYPFFATLLDRHADRAGLLSRVEHIDDVEVRVVELTGAPGDVYLADLRLLHTIAPNARATPRLMATQRFLRENGLEDLDMKSGATRGAKAKQSIDAEGDGRPSPV
jgi:ectoine hydroxylase-related dioxygenase (phytanoyl-CoA dioxygenase family)